MNEQRVIRRILYDATQTMFSGATTGIPRVVRSLVVPLKAIAEREGVVFALLYFDGRHYRVVTDRALLSPSEPPRGQRALGRYGQLVRALLTRFRRIIRTRPVIAASEIWRPQAGDALFLPDAVWRYDPWPVIRAARAAGVAIHCLLHDLLPIKHPALFLPGMVENCRRWWATAAEQTDSLLCVSKAVMDDVRGRLPSPRVVELGVVQLGYDFVRTTSAQGLPPHLQRLRGLGEPRFAMVGTLEPRKNHGTVLDAFDRLLRTTSPATLFIVGRRGWMSDTMADRIRAHPEHERRLFWFENCPDSDLEHIYAESDVLIAASIDEGYGLPIVEARARGLGVLASDIPVFREVAGETARFFPTRDAGALAALMAETASRDRTADPPTSTFASWQDTAETVFRWITRPR